MLHYTLLTRRQFGPAALAFVALSSGCGTVLHPERKGQPAGPLDFKIVALDALGLVFFFVPGVIAFAVDFNNGTIYLPPEDCTETSPRGSRRLLSHALPSGKHSLPGLQDVVSAHLQRPVELRSGRYQTRPLNDVSEFWPTHDEFARTAIG